MQCQPCSIPINSYSAEELKGRSGRTYTFITTRVSQKGHYLSYYLNFIVRSKSSETQKETKKNNIYIYIYKGGHSDLGLNP